jgi:hypothetical protein
LATEPVLKTVEVLKPLGVRLAHPPLIDIIFMNDKMYKEFCEKIQHSIQISIKHGHNDYALGLKKSIMIMNELRQRYANETK